MCGQGDGWFPAIDMYSFVFIQYNFAVTGVHPLNLNLAPCTLHPAPCTLHPAPCTLHPAPCTLHPAP